MPEKPAPKNNLIPVALAATAVAALAGGYFLYGSKNAVKNRKKIKSWALKMKGDVMERLEDLKEVNQELYEKTVDTVAEQYQKAKNATPEEVAEMVSELKSYWSAIHQELNKDVKTAKSAIKSSVKSDKKKA